MNQCAKAKNIQLLHLDYLIIFKIEKYVERYINYKYLLFARVNLELQRYMVFYLQWLWIFNDFGS